MIEVKNLTKKYGDFVAVNEISFTVNEGKILGFLGPNGAGKTTTMRMLTTYMPPTDGTAIIDGYDILTQPEEVRKLVGYLPENPPLYNDLTVEEYLIYVAKLKGLKGKELYERLNYVVESVGLKEKFYSTISTLSKGFRQRVGIAQAIIHDPSVVILDEPTIGLDPNQVIEVRKLIKQLAGSHTVILSTHILSEVTNTCDDVVIINKGEIVAADSIDNLTKDDSETLKYLVEIKNPAVIDLATLKRMEAIDDIERISENRFYIIANSSSDMAELSKEIAVSGAGLVQFTPVVSTLEDIFSKLTLQ